MPYAGTKEEQLKKQSEYVNKNKEHIYELNREYRERYKEKKEKHSV